MTAKLNKLGKHTLIYGFGNVVSRGLAFLLIPLYTAYLTPSDYGILQICRILNSIMFVILLMGMNSSMFRVYYNVDNNEERQLIVNTTVVTYLVFSSIVLIPFFIFSSRFSELFIGVENSQYVFKLLIISIFIECLFSIQLAVLRAEERSKVYSVFSIIKILLYALLSILFVAYLKENYLGAIKAGLLSFLVASIILIPFTLKGFKFQISIPYIREILQIGIPLAIGGLGVWILTLSDRYMLKYLLPSEIALHEIGLYSLGDRIASIVRFLIVVPFMLAWGSLMFAYSKESNAKKIYKHVLYYFTFAIGIVGLLISIFSKEIISTISQNDIYISAYRVVPILIFSKILSGIVVVVSVGVIITKKSKFVAITNITAAIINIILNYFLIQKYEMLGASFASLISFIIAVSLIYYFSLKCYRMNWGIQRIIIFLGLLFFIASCCVYLDVNFKLKIIIFFVVLVGLPLLKVVSYTDIVRGYSLLRNKL